MEADLRLAVWKGNTFLDSRSKVAMQILPFLHEILYDRNPNLKIIEILDDPETSQLRYKEGNLERVWLHLCMLWMTAPLFHSSSLINHRLGQGLTPNKPSRPIYFLKIAL